MRGSRMSSSRMSGAHEPDHAEAMAPDVEAIVTRAGELGFSPMRVAIALGVSPRALASIELAAPPGRDRSSHGLPADAHDRRW